MIDFLSKGFNRSLKELQYEAWIAYNHKMSCRKAKKNILKFNTDKLHLGCGNRRLKGWINVDIHKDADMFIDLRETWPMPDSFIGEIFSEHLLEHFEYPHEAKHFLNESMRVLKPGGRLRLGVPDTEWPLKAYSSGESHEYFRICKERYHPKEIETPLEHINYHFRDTGIHKYAYDERTLAKALAECGFVNVRVSEFDPSTDSADRNPGTLYMTANKRQ